MKTAREMFEECGYSKPKLKPVNSIVYQTECLNQIIVFDIKMKTFTGNDEDGCFEITLELFKAIHKQMEELGWLE